MSWAKNITVTTDLVFCDRTNWNVNRTLDELRHLYENNRTSETFGNVSIENFNCSSIVKNSFKQIISFTQAVSIRIQVLFASIYLDYLYGNNFRFHGLIVQRDSLIKLSSITVDNHEMFDACSSGEFAQDSLCAKNLTHSVCTPLSNPWNYLCSQLTPNRLMKLSNQSKEAMVSPGLKAWQLGLIGGFSGGFVLFLLLLSVLCYRRCRRSKQLAVSQVNLYDNIKSMKNNGTPQGQAFQRVTTVMQPKRVTHTAISWLDTGKTKSSRELNQKSLDVSDLYKQVNFVDHTQIYDPAFPLTILPMSKLSVITPSSQTESTTLSHSPPSTLLDSSELVTDSSVSIDANASVPKYFTNLSYVDDNLTDEDAWMSILDVVNAELAALDSEDRISTLM